MPRGAAEEEGFEQRRDDDGANEIEAAIRDL